MLKRITCLILAVLLLSTAVFGASAAKVTNDTLNIRQQATIHSEKLGVLVGGTEITVLETKNVGNYTWGRILFDGVNSGWIRLDYTDFDTSAVQTVTVTGDLLYVRSKPTTLSGAVGSVSQGMQVTLMELQTVDGYTWGRITLAGDIVGWIRLDYTTFGKDDTQDPEEPTKPSAPSNLGKWSYEDGKWYYYIDGVKAVGWHLDNGSWYYMDQNGVMKTGWLHLSNCWYYLNKSGTMLTGLQTVDGSLYYFNADGVMQVGWVKLGSKTYYMTSSGAAAIGWLQLGNAKYYFHEDATMAVGKAKTPDGVHKFDNNGVWLGEALYYLSDEGMRILKAEEGFSKRPYWDYTQWTVGFGSRCPDDMLSYYQTYGITDEQAEILMRDQMMGMEADIESFIKKYNLTLTGNQYDALVLFTYNCGSGWTYEVDGTFHNMIKNKATGNDLIRAFALWCTAGDPPEIKDYLLRRRLSEANMWLNAEYSKTPPAHFCYVFFDANGGSVSPRCQAYDANLTAAPLSVPKCDGYTFSGWYTAKTGGTKVTALDATHHNKTLYAHWEPKTTPEASVLVTVTESVVNLRTGPGTSYQRLTDYPQATAGEQLTIVETANGDGLFWGRFTEYGGGWICLQYTNYDEAVKQQPKNGWIEENGKWYYYRDDVKATGWLQLDSKWYYLHADGERATGWIELGATKYYLDANGVMVTGTVTIDGKQHKFSNSGAWLGLAAVNGWVQENGKWYYYRDDAKVTGWLQLGGKWYYLNADGVMATGWVKLGTVWYYLDAQGVMVTGTVTIGEKQHKFNDQGAWLGEVEQKRVRITVTATDVNLRTGPGTTYSTCGTATIGQQLTIVETASGDGWQWGRFTENGGGWIALAFTNYEEAVKQQNKNGWVQEGGKWYYYRSGDKATGWLQLGSTWYYLKSDGAMATGWLQLDGVWYYLKSSGAMATGWLKAGNTWYYLKASGAMATGWLQLGKTWYYLNSSGAMLTGEHTIGSVTYLFDENGAWIP